MMRISDRHWPCLQSHPGELQATRKNSCSPTFAACFKLSRAWHSSWLAHSQVLQQGVTFDVGWLKQHLLPRQTLLVRSVYSVGRSTGPAANEESRHARTSAGMPEELRRRLDDIFSCRACASMSLLSLGRPTRKQSCVQRFTQILAMGPLEGEAPPWSLLSGMTKNSSLVGARVPVELPMVSAPANPA